MLMVVVSIGMWKDLLVCFSYLLNVMIVVLIIVSMLMIFYGSSLLNRLCVIDVISVVCGAFSGFGCLVVGVLML
jgi:hypothetical protein